MKKFTLKRLGLVGTAALAMIAGQAFATPCPNAPATGIATSGSPVCLAPYGQDGVGTGLQNILSTYNATTNPYGIILSGPPVNVYSGQVVPSSFWTIGSAGSSANKIVLELAGNAPYNSFGIFDPNNPTNYLQLFSGPASAGATTFLTNDGGGFYTVTTLSGNGQSSGTSTNLVAFGATNMFGYYLDTPSGFFFSDPALNETSSTYPNGTPHMVAFVGNGTDTLKIGGTSGLWLANEYIMAWEDTPFSQSDLDYQDFIVNVESVSPVPEPAALGMFGLGLVGIMFAVWLRRRHSA
ncbi:MAG: PEP-CTERM sorting domain-containing protein [Gammaproteobacteria bacterium]